MESVREQPADIRLLPGLIMSRQCCNYNRLFIKQGLQWYHHRVEKGKGI